MFCSNANLCNKKKLKWYRKNNVHQLKRIKETVYYISLYLISSSWLPQLFLFSSLWQTEPKIIRLLLILLLLLCPPPPLMALLSLPTPPPATATRRPPEDSTWPLSWFPSWPCSASHSSSQPLWLELVKREMWWEKVRSDTTIHMLTHFR